jgi:damage-control phosphatase, subfamily I
MRKECYYCHCKTKDSLIEKFAINTDKAEEFSYHVEQFMQHYWHLSNPLIATHLQRIAKEVFNQTDLYEKEKKSANSLLMKKYDYWKANVENSPNPFHQAAKLAAVGNIIDYGAHAVPDDIEHFIEAQLKIPLAIDHLNALEIEVKNAQSILYLGDNAGEVVFDKLFVETMKHPNLTFAVRNEPVINDITMHDAKITGINKLCKVISNGYDAPSTLLEFCSDKFKKAFKDADLIISKGQGNFEGLMDITNKTIFFLLMAKCDPIAEMLGVEKGKMVIKKSN